jgi:hypothetical protein
MLYIMRHNFILIVFLLLQSLLYAQYNGSDGDGFTKTNLSSITLDNTSLSVMYAGNNGDGFSINSLSSTTLENVNLSILYTGNNGDGFDIQSLTNVTLDNTSLATLYFGGNGDGFSIITKPGITLDNTSLTLLYSAGIGDGFSSLMRANTTLDNTSLATLYSGGNGDGFIVIKSPNMILDNTSLATLYSAGIGDGFSSLQENVFLDPMLVVDLIIDLRVFLQGPLLNPAISDLMNDTLRNQNRIPETSPYEDMASVTNPNVFNDGGITGGGLPLDNIVDWVWVEIRSSADNTNVIDSRSALVQRDGDIVDFDGVSDLIVRGVVDSYYVVVKHRNHLGVMSSNPISLNVSSTFLDFSNSSTSTFGSFAQAELDTGRMALWTGDVNNNGQIRFSGSNNDTNVIKDEILAHPLNGFHSVTYTATGYLSIDVDMNDNGKFSGSNNDSNIIKDNVLAHPSNGFHSPTFTINTTVPLEN